MLDTTTEFGRRADHRLREEQVIWFTSVRSDGQPQPVPVWFFWDGETVLIYSQDNQKVRNIRSNPHVSLHFNTDESGDDVVRLDGIAEVDQSAPLATGVPEMMEKYRDGIERIGSTPDGFARDYFVPIRVRPVRVMGW